ncbi:SURF1 family protein [Nocardia sp. 004]|uniref:SURF1 family cytochrome oxidase biogenesis protein n=1 Tax=Nocardia sp. 004 TaxID=3385978 RepID=UPI00399FBDA7
MRRLTFLLRPSWLILAVLVAAFAYFCFTVLAPWQLGKNTATAHRNQLIADSVRADPVDITAVLADPTLADPAAAARTEWQLVHASGSYVPDTTVLVRLRHLDGAPGYAVLTAFKLDDGRMLLVDRGLVAAIDGTRPPQIQEPPEGRQRLEARIRSSEGVVPGKDPSVQDGYRQVYTIDVDQESVVLGRALTPIPAGERSGYLQLSADQPGAFTPSPLPQLDAGPYLSYGLQWLAFGIMAPLGLGYFVYAEIRERRKAKRAIRRTDTPATESGTLPDEAVPAGQAEPTAPTTADRLADRYGRLRG